MGTAGGFVSKPHQGSEPVGYHGCSYKIFEVCILPWSLLGSLCVTLVQIAVFRTPSCPSVVMYSPGFASIYVTWNSKGMKNSWNREVGLHHRAGWTPVCRRCQEVPISLLLPGSDWSAVRLWKSKQEPERRWFFLDLFCHVRGDAYMWCWVQHGLPSWLGPPDQSEQSRHTVTQGQTPPEHCNRTNQLSGLENDSDFPAAPPNPYKLWSHLRYSQPAPMEG